jgi:hypothetical protein
MTFLGCIGLPILFKMRENLWDKVFTPPEKAVEILDADIYKIYFRTQDGGLYLCESTRADVAPTGCRKVSLEMYASDPIHTQYKYPCVWQFTAPSAPGKVIASREVCYVSGELITFGKFIILDDGSVWNYRTGAGGLVDIQALRLAFQAILGAVVGLVAGNVIVLAIRIFQRVKQKSVKNKIDIVDGSL